MEQKEAEKRASQVSASHHSLLKSQLQSLQVQSRNEIPELDKRLEALDRPDVPPMETRAEQLERLAAHSQRKLQQLSQESTTNSWREERSSSLASKPVDERALANSHPKLADTVSIETHDSRLVGYGGVKLLLPASCLVPCSRYT